MKRKGPRNLIGHPISLGEAPFALCPSTGMAVSGSAFRFCITACFQRHSACCRIDNPSQGLCNARLNIPSSSRLPPSLASSSKFTCSVPPLCTSVHLGTGKLPSAIRARNRQSITRIARKMSGIGHRTTWAETNNNNDTMDSLASRRWIQRLIGG